MDRSSFVAPRLWGLCMLALGALFTGCQQESGAVDAKVSGNEAQQVLKQMVRAYEKAKTYEDAGIVRLLMQRANEPPQSSPVPFSVSFQRPNKLRLQSFYAQVVCDGVHLQAATQEQEGQVLMLDAPKELHYKDLFADERLSQSVRGPFDFDIPQLKLLLADNPLGSDLDDDAKPVLLEDKALPEEDSADEQDEDRDQGSRGAKRDKNKEGKKAGPLCKRVQVKGADGKRVYWIDAESHVLRRLDFPTAKIRKKIDPEGELDRLELYAVFHGAVLDKKVADKAFGFEVPKAAKLLKRFLPPPPQPPSALLGKKVEDFSFVDLDGTTVDRDSLKGKVVVLDMCATWCGWCFKGFPNLEKVYQKYKDNEKVSILAVDTDTKEISDKAVQASFNKHDLTIPIVRDKEEFSREIFHVQGLPTTIILGPDGTVQELEAGYRPDLAEVLPKKIEKLLAGKDLYTEIIEKYEQEQAEYDKLLADSLVGATATMEIPQAKIAKQSEPKSLKLTKLWTAEGVEKPGNLTIVNEKDKPAKILVVDGWRTVTELGLDGKVGARHELAIPEMAAVSFVRTAANGDQRYFAAFGSAQQQLYLFDDQWKLQVSYPNDQHAGLADVQFGDLDGDGEPELNIGYWDVVGAQGVSLKGERLWSNRSLTNVLHVAISDPDQEHHRKLLCTHSQGTIAVIDHNGKSQGTITVPNFAVHTIVSADLDGSGTLELCGLSANDVGQTTALGIAADGKLLWSYELPEGVHQQPIEQIGHGPVLGAGSQWLLPGANGSIHILGADGKLVDKFNYGKTLTGLAALMIEDHPVLLVASSEGLTAWQVEIKSNLP